MLNKVKISKTIKTYPKVILIKFSFSVFGHSCDVLTSFAWLRIT